MLSGQVLGTASQRQDTRPPARADALADIVLHFRRRQGIELPVLGDEKRASYKAAGAKMATMGELVGPSVVAKGILTTARTGRMQTRTIGHPAQLGGAMVIACDGRVVWSHMAHDASDNAQPEEILQAVRDAAGG